MLRLILLVFLFLGYCQIGTASTVNGVEVVELILSGGVGLHVDFFTGFDPSSTSFVYNEAGGTTTTSGSVNTAYIVGKRTLQISIPTFSSGSITVRAEGQLQGQTGQG